MVFLAIQRSSLWKSYRKKGKFETKSLAARQFKSPLHGGLIVCRTRTCRVGHLRCEGVADRKCGNYRSRELKNIYHHHHPESKKRKSSEGNSGSIQPYGRYGNAGKTSKTISTIAILWPVKAIFEKRAATVEVDTFISPVQWLLPLQCLANFIEK